MIRYQRAAARLIHEQLSPDANLSENDVFLLLERPQREDHGDIAFPCFQLAKTMKKAPPAISQDLAAKVAGSLAGAGFESAVNTGPYLNFRLSPASALGILGDVAARGSRFGTSTEGKSRKILLEYSSPNVAKELHIGHFRTTMLGQSLCNLYRAAGWETISVNHLGDWGSQFGKVAWAFLQWGDEKELEKSAVSYLVKLYIRFHEEAEKNPDLDREARLLFKKIEDGDPELTKLWKRFCELSIRDLEKIYGRLGVRFDHYLGESFYFDKTEPLTSQLRTQGLLEESEGAQVVRLGDDMPPCLILTGDGTTLYATRDIAAALWRKENLRFEKCLYVVGSEQTLHFRQVFSVLEKMGVPWVKELEHIGYGLYRFKDGKFSTRKGRVVLLTDVIDEARDKALEVINAKNPNLARKEDVAEMIGFGAVVFNDLSTDRVKDVEFDWERILDFEGDTGPYLQYTHARACSILRQAKAKGLSPALPGSDSKLLSQPAAVNLMKQFGRLEPTLLGAVRLNKPSVVAGYAIDLAKSFNSFYRQVKVLEEGANASEIAGRLGLVDGFRVVLANTLALLCMKAPEEM